MATKQRATKQRLSVTVSGELLREAQDAVAAGAAPTLSAYVEEALRPQSERARRDRESAEHLVWFESEFGPLDSEENTRAVEELRQRSIIVEPGQPLRYADGTLVDPSGPSSAPG